MTQDKNKLPTLAPGRLLQMLNGALAATRSRAPTDDEISIGQAELAKLIGKREAASPSWTRRLAVTFDGSSWLAIVNGITGSWPSPGCGYPCAIPLADAVELLGSAQNPEIALEHAREVEAKAQAEAKERRRKDQEARARTRTAKEKLEGERRDFKADDWQLLSSGQRFAVRLALAVEKRDPALAADIRAAVSASLGTDSPEDFPRADWNTGLGLAELTKSQRAAALEAAEQERDEAVVATIPPADRSHLRLVRGAHTTSQLAAAVRSLREIEGPRFMSYDAPPRRQ